MTLKSPYLLPPAIQWLVFTLVFVVLGGTLGRSLYAEHQTITRTEQSRLQAQAKVIGDNLGEQLAAINKTMDSLSARMNDLQLQGDHNRALNDHLEVLNDAMVGVNTLLILDAQGNTTASNQTHLIGQNFSHRDYFRLARDSDNPAVLHISPPFTTALGLFNVILTKKRIGPQGQFAGLIGVGLNRQAFNTLLESVRYAPDVWSTLAHTDGKLYLMMPPRPDIEGMDLNQSGSFYRRFMDGGKDSALMTGVTFATGQDVMMALRLIRPAGVPIDKPLLVGVAREVPAMFAAWQRTFYSSLGLFAAVFVLSASGLLIFQRRQRLLDQVIADAELDRSRHQQTLVSQAQRAEALLAIPSAAEGRDEASFMRYGLEMAERLTSSQVGFIHFLNDDQETIELVTWSSATLASYCNAAFDKHYPISEAGIWADAVRQRSPVVVNDYASASGKHGLPPGHAQMKRLLCVPVLDAEKVRMMIGVGNKATDYTDYDVETGRLIANAIWRIVRQHQADAAAQHSQTLMNEAQLLTGVGSYVMDIAAGRWESSEALDSLFGIDAEYDRSVDGWLTLVHPQDRLMMQAYLQNQVFSKHEAFDHEYRILQHHSQQLRFVHGLGQLSYDAKGHLVKMTGSIRDVTQRKADEEKVQRLAFYDSLTGLPNRRLMMDRLQHALAGMSRHSAQGALMLIDLDKFKTLNDTLGHDTGDTLLLQVAQRLNACVRDSDTVARPGGDEFIILLEDVGKTHQEVLTQARLMGEKIIHALSAPYNIGGNTLHSTASIGIVLFDDAARGADEEPLKQAELAMYQAKAAGGNALRFYDPQMQSAVSARAGLEARLREAVEKQQFLLYYQAQVNDQGVTTGAEVLLRWMDPLRGMVSPAEFIPLAEETGLILPLGQWVLDTACAQLVRWASEPAFAALTLSVNVSARQFGQTDFVDLVLASLASSGANPQRLKLELTESMLVTDVASVIAKMSALKTRGVGFSLDDFGTGYSSLVYLKRLPLDQLKIDQGFVRDILVDPNDAAIAKTIIALADSMGLAVIAEGVETTAQRDTLARMGCPAFQGYLFSKPVPLTDFAALVRRS